jgi:hypothetical protein
MKSGKDGRGWHGRLLSDLEPYQFQKLELTNHGEISFGFSLHSLFIYKS